MRDVPTGVSGAASGVVNASRQVGTSVGLAVLGSLGVTAAISDWHAAIARLPGPARPGPVRSADAQQAQNVAGAHIGPVTQTLGPAYRDIAAQAFVHGYHVAVGAGAICALAAAVTALLGFRQPSAASARAAGEVPVTPDQARPPAAPQRSPR